MPQALVPIDKPLSIIRKHIPRQSDIDKIVRNIETHVIHSLELPIQAQDHPRPTHPITYQSYPPRFMSQSRDIWFSRPSREDIQHPRLW